MNAQKHPRIVFVCHPYADNPTVNKKLALAAASKIASFGYTPITPHVLFPFLKDSDPLQRKQILLLCKNILAKCDDLAVCSATITSGMAEEIKEAKRLGIRIWNLVKDVQDL